MLIPLDLMEFLESLGFAFSLDAEGELDFGYPPRWRRLARRVLRKPEIRHAIQRRIEAREVVRRRSFRGGPLDGLRHNRFWEDVVAHHVRRGRWAVYAIRRGGAGEFVGWAPSHRKALRLGWHWHAQHKDHVEETT